MAPTAMIFLKNNPHFFVLWIFPFLLTSCFLSKEAPKYVEGVFICINSGAYLKLYQDGSLLMNLKPKIRNAHEGNEDPDRIEGSYSITESRTLHYFPDYPSGSPIDFLFSKSFKKIYVSQGFPGDKIEYLLILLDPSNMEMFELHNL
jgi:hypothetical protein